jgi:hypothetical protein
MAEILKFEPKRKKKPSLGMCQHGHHKWKADKTTQFDSKQGRLVTRYRCERCGKTKVKAH